MSCVFFMCKVIICVGQQMKRMFHVDQQSWTRICPWWTWCFYRHCGQTCPLLQLLALVDLEPRESIFFQFLSPSWPTYEIDTEKDGAIHYLIQWPKSSWQLAYGTPVMLPVVRSAIVAWREMRSFTLGHIFSQPMHFDVYFHKWQAKLALRQQEFKSLMEAADGAFQSWSCLCQPSTFPNSPGEVSLPCCVQPGAAMWCQAWLGRWPWQHSAPCSS